MRRASFHVHTSFCDGSADPEEMVLAAIAAGFSDIGFSAHAIWPFASEWNMQVARYPEYIAEIGRLKAAYAGRIAVHCGFEADYFPGLSAPDPSFYARFDPDFLIGSVHFVRSDRRRKAPVQPWSVDGPASEVARGIAECFDGDGKRAAIAYWRTVREMVQTCRFDIVGHLDLLRKRNGELAFFDEDASWYRRELAETVRAIARSGHIVELNTGAIARKAMDALYPSDGLLALLCRAGVPVMINSDAHSGSAIACAYDRAAEADTPCRLHHPYLPLGRPVGPDRFLTGSARFGKGFPYGIFKCWGSGETFLPRRLPARKLSERGEAALHAGPCRRRNDCAGKRALPRRQRYS